MEVGLGLGEVGGGTGWREVEGKGYGWIDGNGAGVGEGGGGEKGEMGKRLIFRILSGLVELLNYSSRRIAASLPFFLFLSFLERVKYVNTRSQRNSILNRSADGLRSLGH